jgi:hypothetical protein
MVAVRPAKWIMAEIEKPMETMTALAHISDLQEPATSIDEAILFVVDVNQAQFVEKCLLNENRNTQTIRMLSK